MSIKVILKRLGVAALNIFAVVLVTFVLLRNTPGSAIDLMARAMSQQRNISLTEAYKRVESLINYNPKEPMIHQLGRYLNGLLHGSLGMSMYYQNTPVTNIIARSLPWTLFVITIALFISFVIGTNIGATMAWKRKSILDPIVSTFYVITNAIPYYVWPLLILIFFSINLGWFPINGLYSPDVTPGFNIDFILSVFYHAALPIFTVVITTLGGWALSMKSSAIGVLGEDYITAAWARGVSDKRIIKYYVKKNAMLPLITALATAFGGYLGSSIFIETFFSYSGVGYYMNQAISVRDYTLMQGLVLVSATATIVALLIADIIYAWLDPRVKVEG